MISKFVGPAFAIVSVVASSHAIAQGGNCDIELFKAHTSQQSSESTKLFALHLVNEGNYAEARKSASAEFPGYFSGDFKEFNTKRSQKYEETKYKYNHDHAVNIVSSGIDAVGLAAYQACLEGGSTLTATLVKSPTEQLLALRITFRPKTAVPDQNQLVIQVIGATPFGAMGDPQLSDPKSGKFVEKNFGVGERIYLLQRIPQQEFVSIAQLTTLNLAATPLVLPMPPKLVEVQEKKGIATQGGPIEISQPAGAPVGKSWGPQQTCLSPDAGWSLIPNSEKISFSETRNGCVTTKMAFGIQSNVCYNVSLSINAGEICRAMWNVTAEQTRTVKMFQ
jgi:hypothetical protein